MELIKLNLNMDMIINVKRANKSIKIVDVALNIQALKYI